MIEEKNCTPRRRFKEFQNTSAWEQRKLVDEVELFSGLTYSPNNIVKENGTLVLRSSNVKNGEVVNADNVYVDSSVVNSSNVEEGDIIVVVRNGSRSLIGKHAQIKAEMSNTVIGAFMTGIRSDHSAFVNALLNTQGFDSEVEKNLGATINQITNAMFQQMEFMFPKSEEQNRIGAMFTHLDKLITLHQRKLEKIKSMKAAYLTEMFLREGENVPKRRFEGFTDAWEQRKLKDIADYKNGTGYEDQQSDTGKYELVNLNSISIEGGLKQSGRHINNAKETLEINDLVMVLSDVGHGDLLGRVAIIPENNRFVLNQRVALLKIKDNTNPYYLFSYINANQSYFKMQGAGSSQLNISKQNVENFGVLSPSRDEQNKIADYFQNLDNLITLHQRKLDKLKNIKNAYLNEMFI